MIKKILLIGFLSYNACAIDLDPQLLQEIIKINPQAYKEKILLAQYYEKNDNNLKALTLIEEVLKQKPKEKNALKLRHKIQRKEVIKDVFREAKLIQPVTPQEAEKRLDTYYTTNNYQFYTTLYEALIDEHIALKDIYHIQASYIYMWDAHYSSSKKALKRVQQKNHIDVAKIKADICYYQGDYSCSSKLFEKLYTTSYQLEYALKLIQSYIYLGDTTKAKRVYSYMQRKYPKNKKLHSIGRKLQNSQNNYLQNLKKAYEKKETLQTLRAYTVALNEVGKEEDSIKLLHHFNAQHASKKSLLLEAKYLLWSGKIQEALEILTRASLHTDLEAKLMIAQIYSWDHKFKEAQTYLDEVIKNTQDKELLYNARKTLAFIAMWDKQTDKAKKAFKELQKQNPSDLEIKEALMELQKDYKGLIPIYQKRVAKTHNPDNIKHLAQLYLATNDKTKATILLKEYLQQHPQDLELTKELALLLIEKKEYYQGFGYLEYYATQKQTCQSDLLLAKNYYWQGFEKEALDVLDNTLKKYPHSEKALKLKANILKIAPRFTTSNSGATIKTHFDNVASKQLQLADALYFNAHYKASLMYYEAYLNKHPNDHKARYHYAFALEYTQAYGKAEGEFSLVLWTKNNDEVRYHYAYNMMKNHKLKKAKKLFLQLKKESFHTINKKLNTFLTSWKNAWQSQNFQKYATFYDTSFIDNELWSFRKQQTFSKAKYISVALYDPIFKQLDTNRYLIRFYQEYATDKKSDKGYKTLTIQCDATQNECKIIKEHWKAEKYKKTPLLTPYIDNALKEIERLQALPLALRYPKKKKLLA